MVSGQLHCGRMKYPSTDANTAPNEKNTDMNVRR
jgi:hypothetical protein